MDVQRYSIEELSRKHNRNGFFCGIDELDEYLKKDARRHNSVGINSTKVLVEKGCKDIIGFFSFAAASVSPKTFSVGEKSKLPNYEIPCFRLTRFGIDGRYQGKGFGAYLLYCALKQANEMSQNIAAYAVLVDSKSEAAKAFYLKHGFQTLSGLIVYLSMKELRGILSTLNND